MIGYLTGKVIAIDLPTIIIETNQGIGYEVETTMLTSPMVTDVMALYIHHHIREDQQKLFGFDSLQARNLFRILIKTSGVGPKSAMQILSHKPPETIVQAIIHKQPEHLSGIKGVGSKLIDKIIIECQSALKHWNVSPSTPQTSVEKDAITALEQLGYRTNVAKQAVKKRLDAKNYQTNLQELIIDALKET